MVYWCFSTRALEDMFAYAGFAETQRQRPFGLPPGEAGLEEPTPVTVILAYAAPRGATQAKGTIIPDSTRPSVLKAGLKAVGEKPARVKVGRRYSFQVDVTNLGDTIWLTTPNSVGGFVQLGAHLLNENDMVVDVSYGRGRLIKD